MAMNVKELCRLCAANDECSKDLLDESNKNVLKMIQDIVQIFIFENDTLPTKICLNCEERMVTFQMFMLECYKVQDTLRKMCVDDLTDPQIKLEQQLPAEIGAPSEIKPEIMVKDEMTAEDIVSALKNESALTEISLYEDDDLNNVDDDDDEDDDYLDNVAIATLKQIKRKKIKRKKVESKVDTEKLNNILKSPNLKVKDLVTFECVLCSERMKSWANLRLHYAKEHNCEPLVICLCGYEIKSKSILYKHVSDHKLESKKMNGIGESEDTEEQNDAKYANLNVKDFVRFICQECEKECSSWYSLKSHCQDRHDILPTVQCSCGITLKSKSVMYKHIQDHKNPNVLACDKCPRITKTITALNKHKMRHVPKSERKYTCDSCDKIFTTKDALKSHERSHIPIEDRKIYHCEVCNLKFTTRSSAASHKRVVHDKIKGYVCDLCGYACGTGGELRQHRAIHSDDKPFVCRKCNKPFKTYSNLKTHMDTHEETSYECYICRRVLNSRRTLRKHLLVHEDKCRHVCSYCNKAFKRRQTLKVHMYTHTGDKPLTCKWCDERFAYASTLRSHRLRCHPDKMAAHAHAHAAGAAHVPLAYQAYSEHVAMQESYIKNDVVAVSVPVAKNEVEAM